MAWCDLQFQMLTVLIPVGALVVPHTVADGDPAHRPLLVVDIEERRRPGVNSSSHPSPSLAVDLPPHERPSDMHNPSDTGSRNPRATCPIPPDIRMIAVRLATSMLTIANMTRSSTAASTHARTGGRATPNVATEHSSTSGRDRSELHCCAVDRLGCRSPVWLWVATLGWWTRCRASSRRHLR